MLRVLNLGPEDKAATAKATQQQQEQYIENLNIADSAAPLPYVRTAFAHEGHTISKSHSRLLFC